MALIYLNLLKMTMCEKLYERNMEFLKKTFYL